MNLHTFSLDDSCIVSMYRKINKNIQIRKKRFLFQLWLVGWLVGPEYSLFVRFLCELLLLLFKLFSCCCSCLRC